MSDNKIWNRFLNFLKLIYLKLVKIDDTPQKVALGFGLGVFVGIMPFAGPLIALGLAFILRVNRASALLGSLLTNTWLSVVMFISSLKVGSMIAGVEWRDLYKRWTDLCKDFHWSGLFKLSAADIIVPVIIGYILIAAVIGSAAYLIALAAVKYFKK